jgi:hemoglobin
MRRILFVIATVGFLAAGSQFTEANATSESVTPANLSVDEQVQSMEANCAAAAEARSKRHAEKALYERLGGEKKIHALTKEIVRLHLQNESIKHHFIGVDTDKLAKLVAEFVISGTGGPEVYTGRNMKTSHEHLALTNADFVAAGGDVVLAMKNLGYGEEEINAVVCILVSLRDQVIIN